MSFLTHVGSPQITELQIACPMLNPALVRRFEQQCQANADENEALYQLAIERATSSSPSGKGQKGDGYSSGLNSRQISSFYSDPTGGGASPQDPLQAERLSQLQSPIPVKPPMALMSSSEPVDAAATSSDLLKADDSPPSAEETIVDSEKTDVGPPNAAIKETAHDAKSEKVGQCSAAPKTHRDPFAAPWNGGWYWEIIF